MVNLSASVGPSIPFCVGFLLNPRNVECAICLTLILKSAQARCGLGFCRNNGWIMENMDKGLTVPPKWVLIVQPKIPQMLQNLSVQFVCPSPQVLDFNEKRLHCASVDRLQMYLICRSLETFSIKLNKHSISKIVLTFHCSKKMFNWSQNVSKFSTFTIGFLDH
jgi:hypothetical protein